MTMHNKEFKEFYVCKTDKHDGLCYQLRGKEASPKQVKDGTINMINEIDNNNGIAKKATSNNIFKAPAITVSVNFAKNVFYQIEDFCASVNILILKGDWMDKFPLSVLYLCTALRKNNERYNYTHKISKDRLNETKLLLPSKKQYIPDFETIEHLFASGGVL